MDRTLPSSEERTGNETINLEHELSKGFAARCIRRKAKRLIGKFGLTTSDRDDIEQELTLRLLEAVPSFDETKAHWNAFVATVIERHAAKLVRNKKAEKRDHRRATSLSLIVDHDEFGPIALSDVISQEEYDARRGYEATSEQKILELSEDVAAVIASLPSELRDICERLKHKSISEVARDLNIPRTTLNEAVRQIREHFERMGLENNS